MSRKMKESNVDWIGKIPDTWKLNPLGLYLKERKEKVSDNDFSPLSVTKNGIVPQLENAAKSDAHDDRKKVCKNDFVINSRSDRKQSCGLSNLDGSVSLINIVLKVNEYNPKYIKYLLDNCMFAEEFYRNGHGIVADLWTTRYDEMSKIILPFPSLKEQEKIANYLDKKVEKINQIINDTKNMLNLLEEYKYNYIKSTLYKETDKYIKCKYVFNIIGGNGFPEELQGKKNGDFPFCKCSDINGNDKYIEIAKNYVSEAIKNEYKFNTIPKNSLLFAKIGEAMKKNHRKINKVPCCIDNNMQALVIKDNKLYNIEFAYYVFKTINMEEFDNCGTIPSINNNKLKSHLIPLISLDKQITINQTISNYEKILDNIIFNKNTLITKLEEYKKSLIYEVVTGKMEVK